MRCIRLTAQHPARILCLLLAALASVPLAASSSQVEPGPSPRTASLLVSVCDSQKRPVANASLELQVPGKTQVRPAHTDAHGHHRYTVLQPGRYMLLAHLTGYEARSFGPLTLRAGERRRITLTLLAQSASTPASASLSFFDQPQFTIAGVADPTRLGAHGSNAAAGAKDELTREVVSLGGRPSAPPAPSSASAEVLRQRADRNPADFEANRRAGKLLLDLGRPRDALAYLRRASHLQPADYENNYELALAYAHSGQYTQARAALQALLTTRDSAAAHHLLGDVEEGAGHAMDAAREYERAARLDPSETNVFDWGAELLLHGAAQPASEVLNEGRRRYPASVRMLLGAGVGWFSQGDYDRAARYFCQASDLQPGDRQPYVFLGAIQEFAHAGAACMPERLARFVRLRPQDAQANYYYALSLWKQSESGADSSNLPRVTELLQKAARLDPGFAPAPLQLGIIYAGQKQYPQAISSYEQAIAADPRLPDAHYRLAQVWRQTGDEAKARAELQLYQELEKEQGQKAEREGNRMQQFVYTLRGAAAASQAR